MVLAFVAVLALFLMLRGTWSRFVFVLLLFAVGGDAESAEKAAFSALGLVLVLMS